MSWADLFERAEEYETDVETVRETLAARRDERTDSEGAENGRTRTEGDEQTRPDGDEQTRPEEDEDA